MAYFDDMRQLNFENSLFGGQSSFDLNCGNKKLDHDVCHCSQWVNYEYRRGINYFSTTQNLWLMTNHGCIGNARHMISETRGCNILAKFHPNRNFGWWVEINDKLIRCHSRSCRMSFSSWLHDPLPKSHEKVVFLTLEQTSHDSETLATVPLSDVLNAGTRLPPHKYIIFPIKYRLFSHVNYFRRNGGLITGHSGSKWFFLHHSNQ